MILIPDVIEDDFALCDETELAAGDVLHALGGVGRLDRVGQALVFLPAGRDLGLKRVLLAALVRDLRLEVADKLDRFEQNVDLALADHRAGGLQSTPHSDDYDKNGVQFINLGVQTLHSASFRCVVY